MALELTGVASATPQSTSKAAPSLRLPRLGGPSATARRHHLTEQLVLLLDAKMALLPALESIAEQSKDSGTMALVRGLADAIREGGSFADALSLFPDTFPPTYVNLIRAAEEGGFVPRVLNHLLDVEQKQQELRATLSAAFSYPLFLIVFSGAVVVFVLTAVFPKFADLFAGIADQLPPTTTALMWMSDMLIAHYWWLVPLTLVALVAGGLWLVGPAGHRALNNLSDRVPVVNGIMVQVYLVHTLRSLSLSLDNGVSVVDALDAAADTVPNARFRRFLAGVLEAVRAGQGAAEAFSRASFIPALARQLVATGEEAGELGLVAGRLADHYQAELKRALVKLSKLIEPALLLVMGAVVGLIVSSLILPIFKLAHTVQ